MLNVSESTKIAYRNFGNSKTMSITIQTKGGAEFVLNNSQIVSGSMQLTERIETSDNLMFTGCNASVLKFKAQDIYYDLRDAKVSCSVSIVGTDTIPLFHGYIDQVTNTSHEQNTMEITAYDILYKLSTKNMRNWYDGVWGNLLQYVTLKDFRDSLFNEIDIEQVETTLPNDNMLVYKTIGDDTEEISCLDLIKYICQINGRFGIIDRYEKFKYVDLSESSSLLCPSSTLYPSSELYPNAGAETFILSKSHYSTIDFDGYEVDTIDAIDFRDRDDTFMMRVPGSTLGNIFTVSHNPLIYDYPNPLALTDIGYNLLHAIQSIKFNPINSLNAVGLPFQECGDYLGIQTKNTTLYFYILQRTLTGVQALKDSYVVPGDKYYPEYKLTYKEESDTALNVAKQAKKKADDAYEGVSTVQEEVADLSDTVETKQDILTAGTGIDMSNDTVSVTNPITYGTTDIGVGAQLATGTIYFVYEA